MPRARTILWGGKNCDARVAPVISVVLLAACIAACSANREKFAAVDRAGQALRSNTSGAVSEKQYQALLQTFTAEVAAARATASNDGERALVYRFEAACDAYTDALAVWDGPTADSQSKIGIGSIQRIRLRYSLPAADTADPTAVREAIWNQANQLLADAEAQLNSK